jgi:hypothetical protein
VESHYGIPRFSKPGVGITTRRFTHCSFPVETSAPTFALKPLAPRNTRRQHPSPLGSSADLDLTTQHLEPAAHSHSRPLSPHNRHHVCTRAPVCLFVSLSNPQTLGARASTNSKTSFNHQVLIDTTPLPSSIPRVQEIGSSSAPLLSASFFIGARCKPYNDDFMQCKTEANGKGETDCLLEGRKVTRCP